MQRSLKSVRVTKIRMLAGVATPMNASHHARWTLRYKAQLSRGFCCGKCRPVKSYPSSDSLNGDQLINRIETSVETIEEKLIVRLREKFGGDPKAADSLALIGVDSIGMAELTLELESEFGIAIDEDVVDVETVKGLADYIRARQTPS